MHEKNKIREKRLEEKNISEMFFKKLQKAKQISFKDKKTY